MKCDHFDPPWIAELRQRRSQKKIGREIHFFSSTDSTNHRAQEEARKGAPEGFIVMADGQSEGKGRRGRVWESPPGKNLYASVVLRPSLSSALVSQITLITGIAVARALNRVSGLPAVIKWPNDVWVHGKKVAGILTEAEARGDHVLFLILGIGVNVNWIRADIPGPLAQTATSLRAEANREFSRGAVAGEIFEQLEEIYGAYRKEGFSRRLREEWNERSGTPNKWAWAEMNDGMIEGRVLGLDIDGALLLLDGRGKTHRLIAGDISLRW